jgi:hypothetical protein
MRRLPAFWPSVGPAESRVHAEPAFIVFPDGFVADVTRKNRRNQGEWICLEWPFPIVLGSVPLTQGDYGMLLYAILAYHVEAEVMAWTPQEDAGLMDRLKKAHEKLNRDGRLGPAARLGATAKARTLRGPGRGTVIDGPFAETKEQLLGLYVVECADDDAAVDAARTLREANPHAVYEIRPVRVYLPGAAIDEQRE